MREVCGSFYARRTGNFAPRTIALRARGRQRQILQLSSGECSAVVVHGGQPRRHDKKDELNQDPTCRMRFAVS